MATSSGPSPNATACTASASSIRAARSQGPTTTFSMRGDLIGPPPAAPTGAMREGALRTRWNTSEQDRHEGADLLEPHPVVCGAGRGVEVVDVEAGHRGDIAQRVVQDGGHARL